MKSGRVQETRQDGKAGVVRDTDGREYPFIGPDAEAVPGDVVLFDLEDLKVGNKVVTQVAKIV